MRFNKKIDNKIGILFSIILILFLIGIVVGQIVTAQESKDFEIKEKEKVEINKLDDKTKIVFDNGGYIEDSRGNRFEGIKKGGQINVRAWHTEPYQDGQMIHFGNQQIPLL